MKLGDIVKSVEPLAIEGSLDQEITGITYDSRRVMPGNLFVAVRGERSDGHQFVEAAIDRGASAVMLERSCGLSPRATRIRVSDCRRVLAMVSARFYNHPSDQLKVVGVTGTNGKTTTTFILKSIMEAGGISSGLMGTVRYEIGQRVIPAARTTPESVEVQEMMSQMLRAGCEGVVMEVSSHALEMKRVENVAFDVGIFTNLSCDHLDYHGTMKNYFDAKMRLFTCLGTMKKSSKAVVNVDSIFGRELVARLGGGDAVLTCGITNEATIRARNVRVKDSGTDFIVVSQHGAAAVSLQLIGHHNVSNALTALGAGIALGLDFKTMVDALAQFRGVPGRLEEVVVDKSFRVFIDYAHTPDALRSVLSALREIKRKGRLIIVFGCGGDRDKSKRFPMGQTACDLADYSILTTDNPRTEDPHEILQQIEQAFPLDKCEHHVVIEDRKEAIQRALDIAREGDVVLIAGKGHETCQEFADTVVPFSDRQLAEEYCNSDFRQLIRCA